ncbi:hypothetical protein C4552_03905 [Candidatus Parcubacteria bacterium]|nr:MAG: hypothetical protein C4552_03905 [Candidatus Parcubacteria bacterium]
MKNFLHSRRSIAVGIGLAAILAGAIPAAASHVEALLGQIALDLAAVQSDIARITATSTPAERTAIATAAANRLATITNQLTIARREDVLERASAFVASTTAELARFSATTTPQEKSAFAAHALTQLSSIIAELNAIQPGATGAYLDRGDRGAGVTALQSALATDRAIYPEGLITGYFGPLTEAAIKRFQGRHGLVMSGTVDDITLQRLIAIYGASLAVIRPGGTPAPAPAPAPAPPPATTTPPAPPPASGTTTPPAPPSGATTTPPAATTTPPATTS